MSRFTSAATIGQMAKPNSIELPDCRPIRILYEDRTVIAVNKPPGSPLPAGGAHGVMRPAR